MVDLSFSLDSSIHLFSLCLIEINFFFVTMPLKRSSEASAQDEVLLIHSLTKSLCSSPEEADLKKQSLLHQEDDSGIKSGNLRSTGDFYPRPDQTKNTISYFF